MSDTAPDALDPPAPPAPLPPPPMAAPAAAPQPPPPRRRSRLWPVLTVLVLLGLIGAVGYLWQQQQILADRLAGGADPDRLTALESQTQRLAQEIAVLRQTPPPPVAPPAPAVDLAPLEQRLAALEQRQPPPPAPDIGPLTQKLDSVAADAAAAKSGMTGQIADLGKRLDTAEQQAGQSADQAARAQSLARAQVALTAGTPLGDLPGAPPPLARFAHAPPPTEAALRLSFPDAAEAAVRASRPGTAGKSLGERMWLRARALVTVKQGDTVLVGAPAAEVLGHAQARLDAGDVAGAVAALDALDGPAAQAMAAWRGQAQALLDARAALAQMARG